jgi:hypothetical protein
LHYVDNIYIMGSYKATSQQGNHMTTTIFIVAIIAIITGMVSD